MSPDVKRNEERFPYSALRVSRNQYTFLSFKNLWNQCSHLVVEGEKKGVILSFVSLCISDDLSDIPVEAVKKNSECSFCSTFSSCKTTEFSYFSYESLSSLADECSLRNILHGPYSPAHLLCSEELQPGSETRRPMQCCHSLKFRCLSS